jgi:hypothetical protein
MPAVLLLANHRQDTGGFAGFDDTHDFIRLRRAEMGIEEFIVPAFGRFQNRSVLSQRAVLHPVAVLIDNLVQHIAADG